MNFRKYIIEVIIIRFCLSLTILFWDDKKQDNKESEYKLELVKKMSKVQTGITDFVLKKELIQYTLEGRILTDSVTLTNINNVKVRFEKLYDCDESVLFFVFTGESCSKCIELAVEEIKIFDDTANGKIKICIMSNFENYKSQLIFSNKFSKRKIEIFSFRKESGLFPDNIISYPFFFSVNNEKRISYVYIHDQIYSQITHKYLEIMLSKFESNFN